MSGARGFQTCLQILWHFSHEIPSPSVCVSPSNWFLLDRVWGNCCVSFKAKQLLNVALWGSHLLDSVSTLWRSAAHTQSPCRCPHWPPPPNGPSKSQLQHQTCARAGLQMALVPTFTTSRLMQLEKKWAGLTHWALRQRRLVHKGNAVLSHWALRWFLMQFVNNK